MDEAKGFCLLYVSCVWLSKWPMYQLCSHAQGRPGLKADWAVVLPLCQPARRGTGIRLPGPRDSWWPPLPPFAASTCLPAAGLLPQLTGSMVMAQRRASNLVGRRCWEMFGSVRSLSGWEAKL